MRSSNVRWPYRVAFRDPPELVSPSPEDPSQHVAKSTPKEYFDGQRNDTLWSSAAFAADPLGCRRLQLFAA
jgi:hypothetical protein